MGMRGPWNGENGLLGGICCEIRVSWERNALLTLPGGESRPRGELASRFEIMRKLPGVAKRRVF